MAGEGWVVDVIAFHVDEELPQMSLQGVALASRLDATEWQGSRGEQMMVVAFLDVQG